jgi:hypothetical protein
MATLENGHYVGYGHLHFSSVNGREEYIRLVALTTQMLVELSHQALVCSRGDGLEIDR